MNTIYNSLLQPLKRAVESPKLTSWASYSVRAGSLVVLTPLVARNLGIEAFAMWLTLLTIASISLLITVGLDLTFVRLVAYAVGGLDPEKMHRPDASVRNGSSHRASLERVLRLTKWTVDRAAVVTLAINTICVLTVLINRGRQTSVPTEYWGAASLLCASQFVVARGTFFGIGLQGVDCVARFRAQEATVNLAGLMANILTCAFGGGLLEIIGVGQGFQVLGVILLRRLWQTMGASHGIKSVPAKFDIGVWNVAFPSMWRQAVTQLGSQGVIYGSGLAVSLIGNPVAVAGYLLCVRIGDAVLQIGRVPFSSRLPQLARMGASESRLLQVNTTRRLMRECFILTSLGIGVGGPVIGFVMSTFSSSTVQLPLGLWYFYGSAIMMHLYAGLHSGFSLVHNVTITHISVMVFAGSYLLTAVSTAGRLGIYSLPCGYLVGAALSALIVGRVSYPLTQKSPLEFEKGVFIPYGLVPVIGFAILGVIL